MEARLAEDLEEVLESGRGIWNPLKKRTLSVDELYHTKREIARSSAATSRVNFFQTGGEDEEKGGNQYGYDSDIPSDVSSGVGVRPRGGVGAAPPIAGAAGAASGQEQPLPAEQMGALPLSQLDAAESSKLLGLQAGGRNKRGQKKKTLMDYMKEFEKFLAIEAADGQRTGKLKPGQIRGDKKLLKKLMDFLEKGNFDFMSDMEKNEPYGEPWKLLTLYQLATRHLKRLQHSSWFASKNLQDCLDFSTEERALLRKLYLQLCQAHKDARIVAQLLQGRRKSGRLLRAASGSDSDSSSNATTPRADNFDSTGEDQREEGDVGSVASDELLNMEEDELPGLPRIPVVEPDSPLRMNALTGRLEMPEDHFTQEDAGAGAGTEMEVHFSPNSPEVFNFKSFSPNGGGLRGRDVHQLPGSPMAYHVVEPVEKTRRRLYACLTPRARKEVKAEEKKGLIDARGLKMYADCAQKCHQLSRAGGKCVSTLQNVSVLEKNGVVFTKADADELVHAIDEGEIAPEEAERLHYESQMFDLITRSAAKSAIRKLPRCEPRMDFEEPQLPTEVFVNMCYRFGLVTERFEARRCINEYLEVHNKYLEVFPRGPPGRTEAEVADQFQFKERVSTLLNARKSLQFEDFLNVLCWKASGNPDFGNDLRALLKDQCERRKGISAVGGKGNLLIGDRYSVFRDNIDSVPSITNTMENMKTELLIDTIIKDLELKQKRKVQVGGDTATGSGTKPAGPKSPIPGVVAWKAGAGPPPVSKAATAAAAKKKAAADAEKKKKKKEKEAKAKREKEAAAAAAAQRPTSASTVVSDGQPPKVSLGIMSKLKNFAHKVSVGSSQVMDEEEAVDPEELDVLEESRKNARFRLGIQIRDNLDEVPSGNAARKLSLRQRWRMEIRDLDIVTVKRDKSDRLESFEDIKRHVQQGRFFVG